VAGKATAEEHKTFFESLLLPIFALPELPRELASLRIHVAIIGRDTIRVTVMVPNPQTVRALQERKRERDRYAAAEKRKAKSGDGDLPEKPPATDEDILKEGGNPFDIVAKFGIDFSKLVKKFQLRVELAHNLETVQTPTKLQLGDVMKARVAFESIIDPAIVQATIDGLVAAMGDPGAKKLAKAANAHFGAFIKQSNFALSLGDLNSWINWVWALESDGEKRPSDQELDEDIEERLEEGRSLGDRNKFHLLRGDFRRFIACLANARASRSAYRYDDNAAMLMVAKMVTTLIGKDIEEVSAVHVRAKTGLGASVAFDRVLLFPAASECLAKFNLTPSREVRER